MQKEFEQWLLKNDYKPSTSLDYAKRIERLVRTQKYTWEGLIKNIAYVVPEYEKGGKKHQKLGKISHSSYLASIRLFQKFITETGAKTTEVKKDTNTNTKTEAKK
ncbi:MAG: hypothetical protein ACK5N8_05905 [Alphaproteobacteria bacterium]